MTWMSAQDFKAHEVEEKREKRVFALGLENSFNYVLALIRLELIAAGRFLIIFRRICHAPRR